MRDRKRRREWRKRISFIFHSTKSEYDRGVNTFSPEGRLFQVREKNRNIEKNSFSIPKTSPSPSLSHPSLSLIRLQVEYALEAIKLGSTAVGLLTSEGVVLAVEKRVTSPLLEARSIEKIMEIDGHIGCAMSGLVADARTLIKHARAETQNHRYALRLSRYIWRIL